MKISTSTLNILKNFATIDKKIVIRPGNLLQTMVRATLAEAEVEETFPRQVALHDLNNLLSAVNLFKDPEFEFREDALYIHEANGKATSTYLYAGDGIVPVSIPPKLELPADVIEFKLEEEQWNTIQKAWLVYDQPEVKIVSDGVTVSLSTENHEYPNSSEYSTVLQANCYGIKCKIIMNHDNLKLIKGSYTGVVTPDYVKFSHDSGYKLTYYVGVEPTESFFGE